jgi:hypothetical protein
MEDNKLINLNDIYNNDIQISIPKKYLAVYRVILFLFADLGEDMLNDCKSLCNKHHKNILECDVMFQTALASFYNGDEKKADVIIKYIKEQLNILVRHNKNKLSFTLPVDSNGNINLFIESNNDDFNMLFDNKFLKYLDDRYVNVDEVPPTLESHDVKFTITSNNVLSFDEKIKIDSTELYINGIRYWTEKNGDDYVEVLSDDKSHVIGIRLISGTFDVDDEINIIGSNYKL